MVSKDLLSEIVYASGAKSHWEDLKEQLGKINGSRIFFFDRV